MAVNKIDPKVIFASEAPAQDTPAVFTNRTVGWGETRKNGGRPTIKQMNAEQQSTDLKILWLNENAVTPFDSTIDYPTNAVTVKDGVFKIFDGSVWEVFLDKTDIGLGNVDNTSDLNKPISTATQTALDLKADKVFIDNALLLQQEINDRGGATWYTKSGGYALNARVILDNGDIVISTVANNTVDPNIDMTGWMSSGNILRISHISKMLSIINPQEGSLVKVDSYHAPNFGLLMPFSGGGEFIYDSSKSLVNDGGLIINGWTRVWDGARVQVDFFGADPNGVLDSTDAVLKAQKSLTGRTSSDFQARKPSATIEYGIGIYKQGDIPLLSCVNYIGQGREATKIIPNDIAEWVFKTVGSSEGSTITIPTRMIYNSISEMTIGYGYANSLPIANSSCGGVFAEATSWCRMDNVSLHGLGNTALKLIGVFDADFTDVTIFNTGYAQLAPALIIDRVTGSNDGSNATTFTRCHFEGNYQHFQIGKNSRHVYFNWLKMETQTISSTITDPQGVFFNDLEISTTSTSHYEIEFAATAGYSPFVVEFNNPVLIGAGNYFYNNSSVKVKINFGSSRRVAKIAKGRNFVISNHYGYDCGANFIDVENSTIKDCEFLDCKTSLITDGTNDSIILSGNLSRMLGTTITGQGSVSDGRAFVNTSNNSNIRLYDNYFGAGSEFAIRGNANANQFDNSAITKMNSSGSTVYKKMLNKGNGLGVGSVNSAEVLSTVDTSVTLTNIIYGSSLIFLRGSSLISALLFADSTGVLTLISKSSTAEVVIGGAGIVGDGKIYISKSGSNLQIMNRSTSQATIYASVISAVA